MSPLLSIQCSEEEFNSGDNYCTADLWQMYHDNGQKESLIEEMNRRVEVHYICIIY